MRSAIGNSGYRFPRYKTVVNLAPADIKKVGPAYDLPIALGLMGAIGAVPPDALHDYLVLGELALDGRISPVSGTLPAAIAANSRQMGIICPELCGPEAAWASEDIDIVAPASLLALVNHLAGRQLAPRPVARRRIEPDNLADMAEIRGQQVARRVLEIAAAGGHNMLMVGPPGAGKSMLASRLPSILPPLNPRELLDVSMIRSIAGELADGRISDRRPFRCPHHSASMPALVGGGLKVRPGEASLAHNGVLFLDELPEFSPRVLDSLRQPMEAGQTVIARANARVTYPARFQLIAAMNPCKCGMAGTPGHTCRRGERCASDYQGRISGPFLDRIDLRIDVPAVSASDMFTRSSGETSKEIGKRVAKARKIQRERYIALTANNVHTNSAANPDLIETIAGPDRESRELLVAAAEKFSLSARAYHRVLKVARTLADLGGSQEVRRPHIAEALSYRLNLALVQVQ